MKNFARVLAVSLALLSSPSFAGLAEGSAKPSQASLFQYLPLNTQNMMAHLNAFQKIARQSKGNRAVGSKGGKATNQYILAQLNKTPYAVQVMNFKNEDKKAGQNIIVDIKGKKDKTIIIGAHTDSVTTGPGINDNASGTAVLLDFIQQLAKSKKQPNDSLRVIFWDSEEYGLAGSSAYVKSLTAKQLKQIKSYLNLDMVGTKNPDTLVFDANKSSLKELEALFIKNGAKKEVYEPMLQPQREIPTHPYDLVLEKELITFYKKKGIKIKQDLGVVKVSDADAFLGKVPVAVIIMFHEQLKGNVLEFAPCYHRHCDTIDKVDPASLKIASDALLHLLKKLEAN